MSKSVLYDHNGRELAWSQYYTGLGASRERSVRPILVGDSHKTNLTKYNRTESLALVRYLAANVGIFRGPLHDMATYSVGSGLKPRSQVTDPKAAKQYEDYFGEWGIQADYTGRHTFNQLQYLASLAIDVDGDVGFNMYAPGASALGQLQLVESHRITGDDDGFYDGVKANAFGRPLTYRILQGEKDFLDIDAGDFIFLYDPDRADANRGITSMAHAIDDGLNIQDILRYEKVGVLMNSAIGWAITTQSGNADPGTAFIESGFTAAATGGLPWETLAPGMIPRLKVGEDITSFGSNRPSQAFMGFLEFLIRNIAVGLGLPFEFIWDLTQAKGTGSRFILAKAQRRFEQRQQLLIDRFCNRVWRWVIAKGIKRGDLPALPFWWTARWQAPAKITVDMGREAVANRDDLKYGNRTLEMDAGEQGLDWRDDLRDQTEIEAGDLLERAVRLIAKAKTLGQELSLEKALWLLSKDGPNPPPPTPEPPDDPAPPKKR